MASVIFFVLFTLLMRSRRSFRDADTWGHEAGRPRQDGRVFAAARAFTRKAAGPRPAAPRAPGTAQPRRAAWARPAAARPRSAYSRQPLRPLQAAKFASSHKPRV